MAKIKSFKNSDFVHLHNHTEYSLLDGLTKIPELIQFIKQDGMEAVAITDHGTMSGTIEFYKEAVANDIKPIIGIETYIASRSHLDKESDKDKLNYHLILLAMNNEGYLNLMKLSTIANLDGFYYKPRIDHQLLEENSAGLICLSGCIGSELGEMIRQGQYQEAKKIAQWYKSVFKDRYYIEIQDHGHPEHPYRFDEQVRVNQSLLKLAKELQIEAVLTCDAHYLKHSDQLAHEILLCVQTGSFLSDEKRMSLKELDLHVMSAEEIFNRWGQDYPELILNSKKIADRCQVDIELGKILIPRFLEDKKLSEKDYLDQKAYQGLVDRYLSNDLKKKYLDLSLMEKVKLIDRPIVDRMNYELGVIDKMGFNGYFLIVADFINWGKNEGIVFGPGRGSAAGSIVAYCLRITELDPLKYNLLFERFLNPERISMPDVDIDIQDNRRQEVINYCINKYGKDRVANIVTFGKMAARNAIRDVARVLEVPYAEADRLAKMVPPPVQGRNIPLKVALEQEERLKLDYSQNETSKKIIDLAMQLENTIRSHGVHAAGVVIAPETIYRFTPLEIAQKGVVATQYSMGPIEELGLLKMDFLGLSNLTIIKNTLRIIKKVYHQEIDINHLDLSDQATYQLLQNGDTTGVFQFESSGMKKYLKDLKPSSFEDIVAMGALYRPGPLSAGLTDSFIKRKNGQEKIEYLVESMKPALESTYGVLVYQEQFMQISRDVCGFSGAEADTLRKAIGKKKRDIMEKMEKRFIEGAVKNGVDRQVITNFWQQLLGFADYCFNKSHSVCYGFISFQTAYLKAHYPLAFMAALMSSDYDNIDRLAIEINECQRIGIKVLPPDVNYSYGEFSIDKDKNQIRFGLHAIKNIGQHVVDDIIEARNNGRFLDLSDFLTRVNHQIINKKTIESLIKSGALDCFGDRLLLLSNLDNILAFANRFHKQNLSTQVGLFSGLNKSNNFSYSSIELKNELLAVEKNQFLVWERELLGIYLSQHPLEHYQDILSEQAVSLKEITPEHHSQKVVVGGIVTLFKEVTTKNKQKMAFVTIEDFSSSVEIIVFPQSYSKTIDLWQIDQVLLVTGRIEFDDSRSSFKILAEDARQVTFHQAQAYIKKGKKKTLKSVKSSKKSLKIADLKVTKKETIYIKLLNSKDSKLLVDLKTILESYKGDREVILVLGDKEDRQAFRLAHGLKHNDQSIQSLKALLGEENVKVQ